MRRKDREVTDYNKMKEIAWRCDCCRLGFKGVDGVYIVPLNFGIEEEEGKLVLYFHSAAQGKKIDLINEQPYISFEMDTGHAIKSGGDTACEFGFKYESIMGKGTVSLVTSYDEKLKGLKSVMNHYTGKCDWGFDEKMVNHVAVIKLVVDEWRCKVC